MIRNARAWLRVALSIQLLLFVIWQGWNPTAYGNPRFFGTRFWNLQVVVQLVTPVLCSLALWLACNRACAAAREDGDPSEKQLARELWLTSVLYLLGAACWSWLLAKTILRGPG